LAWRRCCQHITSARTDGRVVQTDAYGNKRYDKPQLKVEGTKVYQTDAYRAKQQRFEVKQKK
jgi:hypothetical protein